MIVCGVNSVVIHDFIIQAILMLQLHFLLTFYLVLRTGPITLVHYIFPLTSVLHKNCKTEFRYKFDASMSATAFAVPALRKASFPIQQNHPSCTIAGLPTPPTIWLPRPQLPLSQHVSRSHSLLSSLCLLPCLTTALLSSSMKGY